MAEPEVLWDEERRRFTTRDGLAYLSYAVEGGGGEGGAAAEPKVYNLQHTYVPPSKRGSGVAAKLCEAACVHAEAKGIRIIPSCSYVSETFLARNPQWKKLVLG